MALAAPKERCGTRGAASHSTLNQVKRGVASGKSPPGDDLHCKKIAGRDGSSEVTIHERPYWLTCQYGGWPVRPDRARTITRRRPLAGSLLGSCARRAKVRNMAAHRLSGTVSVVRLERLEDSAMLPDGQPFPTLEV